MLRALPLAMRNFPSQKLPVTPEILDQICAVCVRSGSVLKVAFTLTLNGFLRQSNIAPASLTGFDPSRHTTRGAWPYPLCLGCPTQVAQNTPGPRHHRSGPDPQCAWSEHRPSSRLPKHASCCPHLLPSRLTANIAQSEPSYQPLPPEGAEVHPHSAGATCACVLPAFIQARRHHYSSSGGCRFHWHEASQAKVQWHVLGLRCRPPAVELCRCDGPV